MASHNSNQSPNWQPSEVFSTHQSDSGPPVAPEWDTLEPVLGCRLSAQLPGGTPPAADFGICTSDCSGQF